jgi:hypothetical protein
MNLLLGVAPIATWGLVEWAIFIIVICAVIAVVYIVVTQVFKVTIPGWLIQILWVCLGALVAILAIRFLIGLL